MIPRNPELKTKNLKLKTHDSPERWRLLITTGHDGAYNMALDTAILEQVGAGVLPPTLRLFDWNPTCLTLGHAQPAADADLARLRARGWDLTRRPTGGRAILHTDEITYSVALPADHPLVQGDIVTSYRRLSRALLAALERLGAPAQADPRPRVPETDKGPADFGPADFGPADFGPADSSPADQGPVCFEVPSDYEITADGRKLIGSAQVRRRGGVLQHGSLPLWGDIARICDALAFPDETAREAARVRVRQRATTLEAALGRRVSWDEAAAALAAAFAETLGLALSEPEPPTPAEVARADELRRRVYADDEWNLRL